jgi:phage head maturation protease
MDGDHIECRCDLPNTNNDNDVLELMKRGDITGMSFAFQDDYQDSENGVSYERTNETHDGKEVWVRHVKRITGLYHVSIVTSPAYQQTSVGTREASDAIENAIDEQLKRENTQETEEEREQRELEEQAERNREEMALRQQYSYRKRKIEIDSLIY